MNTKCKMLKEIILDLLGLLFLILDWDMKMDSLRDWEKELLIDKFLAYSLNNILNFVTLS